MSLNEHEGAYLTTSEAAEYLRMHPKTLERLARAGEVRHARIGRRYLFKRTWLDEARQPQEIQETNVTRG